MTVRKRIPLFPFGPLTDLQIGPYHIDVELPIPAAELRRAILEHYPAFAGVTFRLAVDKRLCRESDLVENAEEIALLPPFAGG